MKTTIDYLGKPFTNGRLNRLQAEISDILVGSSSSITEGDQVDGESQVPEEKIVTVGLATSYLLFFVACCDMCLA